MKRTILSGLLALGTALLALAPLPLAAQTGPAARVIVSLKADSTTVRKALPSADRRLEHARVLGQRQGIALTAGRALSERAQVVFAQGISSAELARRLARDADVEYAVPDERQRAFAAPNDPLYAEGLPGNGPAAG